MTSQLVSNFFSIFGQDFDYDHLLTSLVYVQLLSEPHAIVPFNTKVK